MLYLYFLKYIYVIKSEINFYYIYNYTVDPSLTP